MVLQVVLEAKFCAQLFALPQVLPPKLLEICKLLDRPFIWGEVPSSCQG